MQESRNLSRLFIGHVRIADRVIDLKAIQNGHTTTSPRFVPFVVKLVEFYLCALNFNANKRYVNAVFHNAIVSDMRRDACAKRPSASTRLYTSRPAPLRLAHLLRLSKKHRLLSPFERLRRRVYVPGQRSRSWTVA